MIIWIVLLLALSCVAVINFIVMELFIEAIISIILPLILIFVYIKLSIKANADSSKEIIKMTKSIDEKPFNAEMFDEIDKYGKENKIDIVCDMHGYMDL